jgi:hypothetical protein
LEIRKFIPQPKIYLREDKISFDKQLQEEVDLLESFNYTNNLENITKYNKDKEGSIIEKKKNVSSFYNNIENNEIKNTTNRKSNSFIISAGNILNMKKPNNNIEIENNPNSIINQSSFLNKSNYSQDIKNFQNEYWLKRRNEPHKYLNNNIGYDKINIFNDSMNNDSNYFDLRNKEPIYRSSELDMNKAMLARSKQEEVKLQNEKNMDILRHQKKIEFKNDVVINRKKMGVIEGSIKDMVTKATHRARDSMDIFMINALKEELITIEK